MHQPFPHGEKIAHAVDIGSAALVLGALMKWLPPITALLGAVWYAVNIVISVSEWRRERNRRKSYRRRISDHHGGNHGPHHP